MYQPGKQTNDRPNPPHKSDQANKRKKPTPKKRKRTTRGARSWCLHLCPLLFFLFFFFFVLALLFLSLVDLGGPAPLSSRGALCRCILLVGPKETSPSLLNSSCWNIGKCTHSFHVFVVVCPLSLYPCPLGFRFSPFWFIRSLLHQAGPVPFPHFSFRLT